MKGATVAVFVILGVLGDFTIAEYLNNRPYPKYSLENMPETEFTCRDKVLGGYYADRDTQCQMFHVCVKVAGVGVQDFRFLCPNGTAFDQDHQICAEWDDVDCDSTTLYYSSDNFDLYRLGSGFESKAVRYGEDEEPFALQRAETGDIRINKEKESQKINQQKEYNTVSPPRPFKKATPKPKKTNDNEKDIFKGSSSSHYFNNRNNGKEFDEDYDDENVNGNQNEDRFQTRKVNRKPVNRSQYNQEPETRTSSPKRPTGFVNNFAGSSYSPTTQRSTTTTTSYYRQQQRQNYNNNEKTTERSTPEYTVSTPSPFRQTQQYNNNARRTTQYNNNNGRYDQEQDVTKNYPKQKTTKETENYPTTAPPTNYNSPKYYNTQYKTKTTETENYPTTPNFENQKQKNFKKIENYPTTYIPKNTAPQRTNSPNTQTTFENYPTTFSPRTNSAFTQLSQQTTKKQTPAPQPDTSVTPTQYNPQNYYNRQVTTSDNKNTQPVSQKSSATTQQQTQTTQFTQYTPTVPKITTKFYSTTAAPKFANRYDETQYDENVDDSKEESLSGAHSTNIANSKNELLKSSRTPATTTTQKPRPFSLTTSKPAAVTQSTTSQNTKPAQSSKKPKDYDYAYYDSNSSEPVDYDVHADIRKSEKKQ